MIDRRPSCQGKLQRHAYSRDDKFRNVDLFINVSVSFLRPLMFILQNLVVILALTYFIFSFTLFFLDSSPALLGMTIAA